MPGIRHWLLIGSFGAGLALQSSPALSSETGTIEGQVLLDGEAPKLDPRVEKGDKTVKDAEVCAAEAVPNETLVVDPKSGGVANVVIYLRKAPAGMPEEAKVSTVQEVDFDQKGCRFVPHVIAVRTDQTVMCKTKDSVAHNLHGSPFSNKGFNFAIPGNSPPVPVKMPETENLPVRITCDLHPWMDAWWVVTDHPYVAVTDTEGKFKIENLPVGKHSFTVWHESAGYINRNFQVTVKAGNNPLPAIKAPLAKFKLTK